MTPFRRLKRRTVNGLSYWYAEVYDPSTGGYRQRPLFPRRDERAATPSLVEGSLGAAWQRISDGKLPTKSQAQMRAAELAREVAAAHARKGGKLSDLIELELKAPGRSGKMRSVGTMNSVIRVLRRWREFMADEFPRVTEASEVSPVMAQGYASLRLSEGVSTSTVRNEVSYLRAMFNRAVDLGVAPSNPFASVRLRAKSSSERRTATADYTRTPAELDAFLEACRDPYDLPVTTTYRGEKRRVVQRHRPPRWLYPFALLSVTSGCRKSELLERRLLDHATGSVVVERGLAWSDIDWGRDRFYVTGKTGTRAVPLLPHVAAELHAYREDLRDIGVQAETVLVGDDGEPVVRPHKAFGAAAARAGLGHVRIHDLRHSALSHMAEAGMPTEVLRMIAGHASITTTELYMRTTEDSAIEDSIRRMGAKWGAKENGPESGAS